MAIYSTAHAPMPLLFNIYIEDIGGEDSRGSGREDKD